MWSHRPLLRLLTKPTPILSPGADLGGGCPRDDPPPRDDPRFSNTTCILPKKNYVVYWCWSRARDECNPLLKKILDPPLIPEYICHGSPKLELTSSKRHIKTFHVVVMQGRQRNVPNACWTCACTLNWCNCALLRLVRRQSEVKNNSFALHTIQHCYLRFSRRSSYYMIEDSVHQ